MYKATYKDITRLIDNTSWDDGVFNKDEQVNGYQIAYFASSGTNWAYRIELIRKNNHIYEVVTVFGGVRGYRYIGV